jgi:hypothetical protein
MVHDICFDEFCVYAMCDYVSNKCVCVCVCARARALLPTLHVNLHSDLNFRSYVNYCWCSIGMFVSPSLSQGVVFDFLHHPQSLELHCRLCMTATTFT